MADHAYVTFLDILGYKESLEGDLKRGTQEFRTKMQNAFRAFEDINQSVHKYQAISDSIFMNCSDRQAVRDLFSDLRSVFVSFLREGLLIRGGMSFGQHFQNMSMTYSPTLTKAYLLESKLAEFPRIMIDGNILDMFPDLKDSDEIMRSGANWFLNIASQDSLDQLWKAAKNCYLSNLSAIIQNERVRSKHKWLQDYLIDMHVKYGAAIPEPYLRTFDVADENFIGDGDLSKEQVLSKLILSN